MVLNDFKYGRGWRVGLEETVRADVTDNFSLLGGGLAWYSDIIPKATFPGGFDPNLDTIGQAGSFFYSDTVGGTLQAFRGSRKSCSGPTRPTWRPNGKCLMT